jgi:hypothetical protein
MAPLVGVIALLSTMEAVGLAPLPTVPLAPGDIEDSCPEWALTPELESADHVCIRSTTSIARQDYYTGALARAGWTDRGGLANVLGFERDGQCLALVGLPLEEPRGRAVGIDHKLFGPPPPEEGALFMFLRSPRSAGRSCEP